MDQLLHGHSRNKRLLLRAHNQEPEHRGILRHQFVLNLQYVLEETQRTQILRALEEAEGVVAGPDGAAARLGLKRSTLRLRMRKLWIHLSPTVVDGRKTTH